MKNKLVATAAVTLGVATAIVTAARLLFGVDFTDEALYAVMPYRSALGAKPFVDELLFQQTSAFLSYPFVKIFYLFTGGTSGIILYMRFLYLFFMVGVGLCVWFAIRRVVGRPVAAIVALPCVAFVYFNIPSLTYNTLGLGFLAVGCFLGYYAVATDRRWLLAAGAAHGLAVIAYPSLAAAIIVFACSLIFLSVREEKWWRSLVRYGMGGMAIAAGFLILFYVVGFSHVLESYRNTAATGIFGGGLAKIVTNVKAVWSSYQGKLILLVGLIAALSLKTRRPARAGLLLLALPFVPLSITGFPGFLQSAGYISYYALLAPYVYLFVREESEAGRLLWLVWLPGFVAGALVAYTSSNGYLALSVGFFPGALVTSVLFYMALKKLWSGHKAAHHVGAVVVAIPVIILLVFQFGQPYRDDNIGSLTARITSGGYAGLYTTPAKREFLASVTRDLERVKKGAGTVLVFDNFPAGYLVSELKPYTDKAWIAPMTLYQGVDRGTTVNYYRQNGRFPDMIVRMNTCFYTTDFQEHLVYSDKDSLNRFAVSSAYQIVVKRPNYVIFERQR